MFHENPHGMNGFEFVEFASAEPDALAEQFEKLGFVLVGNHRHLNVRRYAQGDINFLLNLEPRGHAGAFSKVHGPSASAMAFRIQRPDDAARLAVERGASPAEGEYGYPAVEGIGGALLYLVGSDASGSMLDRDFNPVPGVDSRPVGVGLEYLDHLTHNVFQGRLNHWANYYEQNFNFREIKYFDIRGEQSALVSRAMTAPDNKIRIPLNESKDEVSQIAEYLREYNGEGIQHLALSTSNIFATVDALRARGVRFLEADDVYYDELAERLPGHGHSIAELRKRGILIDGSAETGEGVLLQIFTENMIGPIFFEIIQREGNEGFGEGNFNALFRLMERDQKRRGVLPA